MKKVFPLIPLFALATVLLLQACGPTVPKGPYQGPRYVIVLPPENRTVAGPEVEEIVYPLAYEFFTRRGFYCVSPELARAVFNRNKLEDAGRINALPPEKIREVFGVDAVLRVAVTDWSSKYIGIDSWVTVGVYMELVDCNTGNILWKNEHTVRKGGAQEQNIWATLLVNALNAAFTSYRPLAEEAVQQTIQTAPIGAYYGKW